MTTEDSWQGGFLEPIVVPAEKSKKVKGKVIKKKERKPPKPKKSEIALAGRGDGEINILIRDAVRGFVKNNKQFSVYALLGGFHTDSYNVVKDWYLGDANNREWVFLRLINAGIFPDDNEFQEFYQKWSNR